MNNYQLRVLSFSSSTFVVCAEDFFVVDQSFYFFKEENGIKKIISVYPVNNTIIYSIEENV